MNSDPLSIVYALYYKIVHMSCWLGNSTFVIDEASLRTLNRRSTPINPAFCSTRSIILTLVNYDSTSPVKLFPVFLSNDSVEKSFTLYVGANTSE